MTVQLPSDSTEFSFLTITFFFPIRLDAIVSAIVSANGSPSGIADTDKATTVRKIDLFSYPLEYKITTDIIEITMIIILICLENFSILIVSGDFSSWAVDTDKAIFPISVLTPVATTTAKALPVIMLVLAYNILVLSAKGVSSFRILEFLICKILSPVNVDSST